MPLLELFAGSIFGMDGRLGMLGMLGIVGIAGKIDATDGALLPKNNMITVKSPRMHTPNITNGAKSCNMYFNCVELYSEGKFL